jgi:hypothetical protein
MLKRKRNSASEGIRPACKGSKSVTVRGGKTTLTIECKDCLSNASLTNSICREGVFSQVRREKDLDSIILKKRFQKVYGKETIRIISELIKTAKQVEGRLCAECQKKVPDAVSDPIGFYYGLEKLNCKGCERRIE